MIKFMKKDDKPNIDKEIKNLLLELDELSPTSDEYQTILENVERLSKAKSYEQKSGLSPDTVAVVAGNLLGIAMIIWHERVNVITSKALGFIIKGRV